MSVTNATGNDASPVQAEAGVVTSASPGRPSSSLETLIQAAEPLARAYFENQRLIQTREIELTEKVLIADAKRDRMMILLAAGVAAVVLGMSGLLMAQGQMAGAMDLIKLTAGLGGAAFGGFGLASRHQNRERDSD